MNTLEFVTLCADKAKVNEEDPTALDWASRMFAFCTILGERISDEDAEALAEAMSRAPAMVVLGGTINLRRAKFAVDNS